MNTYWVSWIDRLKKQAVILVMEDQKSQLDEAVEWCVLGMLRQLYTIREHSVISKIAAGEYGMKVLPIKWHGLMREAISIKLQKPISEYTSQSERLDDLIELLRTIHFECNK